MIYHCPKCGRRFWRYNSLIKHIDEHLKVRHAELVRALEYDLERMKNHEIPFVPWTKEDDEAHTS